MSAHTPGPLQVLADVNGRLMRIGTLAYSERGYRYLPMYQAGPSRKEWPTPEDALRGRVKNYTLMPIAKAEGK